MNNKPTLLEKTTALVEYLKTKPIDHWSSEEEIIGALPTYFKAKHSHVRTSLDTSIYACMEKTQQELETIIINNGKRAYKLATKQEAEEYADNKILQSKVSLKRFWAIKKQSKNEGSYDLFDEEFVQRFVKETFYE